MQLSFNPPDPSSSASSKTQVISHALNNLLCVITANADVLSEQISHDGPGEHSLSEIRRAAKSASDLMRLLK
jgi:predicted ABC-type ATPase